MALIKKNTKIDINIKGKDIYLLVYPLIGSAQDLFKEKYIDRQFITKNAQLLYYISVNELKELVKENKWLFTNIYCYHVFDEDTFNIKYLKDDIKRYSRQFSLKDISVNNGQYSDTELWDLLEL